ncbi:CTP synthase [Treponema parvum]|uniref:CTP synthase (glutamine hydrolyzing) n=1 Tax=Treponema parvum TaxID=138851 RepID=A0A975F791_9SPIR|nr:CTP synthase [Treponema parvum]QTQ12332.1 CTP synthase [Treponema parvum]QTQ15099.1 CTP synthase [Treponema parvum]QTQ15674.1 CTP synthase [Treponema parvum]
MSKYVLVTSGVCSSLGKGVASASLGSLFECCGYKVAMMKCDPYINVDAGNISPYQHGEVFVTEDGAETDLDLGNFSRFTDVNLTSANCITIGKVYNSVIKNERAGRYNGRTVQVIPHITDEIKRRILNLGSQSGADIVLVEVGGTVGDIETIPFLEAVRQLIRELGRQNTVCIHLALVPIIIGGELKSKPIQHSVKQLQEAGIQPDILLCRCEQMLDEALRKKVGLFCNVSPGAVFTSTDVEKSIYELPVLFHEQKIDAKILEKLGLKQKKCDISIWTDFLDKLKSPLQTVTVGMVGKKDYLDNCYKSVRESLFHAAVTSHQIDLKIEKIDAETLENIDSVDKYLNCLDGIVVPGNYGQRGFLGLLAAVKYAREHKVPYLGIDLGMQLMAVETARSLLKWEDADSTEFMQNCKHAIISLPEEQAGITSTGVMKLGAALVNLNKNTKIFDIYKKRQISERHRSKYTFDKRYEDDMAQNGLITSATAVSDSQTEAFEWKDHPWGIGVQYHPEFVSRPSNPHPLFIAFIGAVIRNKQK